MRKYVRNFIYNFNEWKKNEFTIDKVSSMFELEILTSSGPFVDKFIAIFKGKKFRRIVVILETNIHEKGFFVL
jgi:hypothetical protein